MVGLFKTASLPAVKPPEQKPEVTPEDTASVNERLRQQRRTTRGRRSTIVTSGLGLTGDPAVQKTRLGGF